MQQIKIPFVSLANESERIECISEILDQRDKQLIRVAPWSDFSYQPTAAFVIAHDGNNIFLKYYVEENALTAIHRETNGEVYKDSCVEFFIAFNDEQSYYNIEFNCAGSCHIGFGDGKENRQEIPHKLIEEIKHQALFKTGDVFQQQSIKWELTLIIPIAVFYYHDLSSLNNHYCRVNFYKCGDELPQPHYLSWTNMYSDLPNFHLPEFFGEAFFSDNQNPIFSVA